MKIFYVANSRLPTPKAYGRQIVKMCEAFTKVGLDCELVIPRRIRYPGTGADDILKFYKIKTPFKVIEINSVDLIRINLGPFFNKVLFWVQQSFFASALSRYLGNRGGIVYSRDQFSLSKLDSKKYKLFWEAHNLPQNINSKFYKKILNKISGIVAISKGLASDISKYFSGPLAVAHDGVDLGEFNLNISKEEARERLGLPTNKKIATYAGHLYSWKGVDCLVKSAEYLDEDSVILIVGGTGDDLVRLRLKIPPRSSGKIILTGFVSHQEVGYYLKASDCVVLTGKSSEIISEKYTSPLKLFEYMASQRPIVAQDLSSFREILNGQNSILVEPENPEALAVGIKKAFTEEELTKNMTQTAYGQVHDYTWEKRAQKILEFVQNNSR